MNILLLGSGGRECALAWKIKQSPKTDKLYIAPGNAGTAAIGTNVAIPATDFDAIGKFAVEKHIDMVVVGPEDPLVKGIYDYFVSCEELKNIPVIGPSKEGARLEGSKEFAKGFMMRHNIPTARYESFTQENLEAGYTFLETLKAPYVLKADGLAAGKGVLIINDLQEAKDELKQMLNGMFGNASKTVVIEEFLSGIECSVFVLTDGKDYRILPVAKDYKRIGEGDTGLNTGGMGAVSPVRRCHVHEKSGRAHRKTHHRRFEKRKYHVQGFHILGIDQRTRRTDGDRIQRSYGRPRNRSRHVAYSIRLGRPARRCGTRNAPGKRVDRRPTGCRNRYAGIGWLSRFL